VSHKDIPDARQVVGEMWWWVVLPWPRNLSQVSR